MSLRMASRGPDTTPADSFLLQIDYEVPLRGPWPPWMQIHMQNESDDSVPALVSDSESSEDEVWTDFSAAA